jgi:PBP superfamily domain
VKISTTLAAAGLALATFATPAVAVDISGAGATFPYPLYAKWADAYRKETGNGLNYQSIGSGGGIKQIQSKTVTFGASDMPLKPEELKKSGLLQFRSKRIGMYSWNARDARAAKIMAFGSVYFLRRCSARVSGSSGHQLFVTSWSSHCASTGTSRAKARRFIQEVVFVVAPELRECFGGFRFFLGDEVPPDLPVWHLLLGENSSISVDVVPRVDEEVGLVLQHRVVDAHAPARLVDAPTLARRVA